MRKILFRGKRLDNGEWVDGHLYTQVYHPDTIEEEWYWFIKPIGSESWVSYRVDTSTVGQYTGLKDKNGERIFEGDMIKPFDDEIDKMVVEFHHGQFLLCLYGERGYMTEYGWEEEGNYGCFESEPILSYGDDIEIIGNIHD